MIEIDRKLDRAWYFLPSRPVINHVAYLHEYKILTSTQVGVRSIAINVFVCLFVCLFVCPLAYLENYVQILPNVLYMLSMVVARFSFDGSAMCYVILVLRMTSCFRIIERMGRNQKRRVRYVSSSSLGGGTRVEVCRLRGNLVFKKQNQNFKKTAAIIDD